MPAAVVILGGGSAVAEQYARRVAGRGARCVLVGRDGARLRLIGDDLVVRGAAAAEVVVVDLADPPAGFSDGWAAIVAAAGGPIGTVLLAYGQLGEQARAERDPAETIRLIGVNMASACGWLTAAAATLERQGHGSLIVIGSVAGDRGRGSNYVYGAAKAGLAVFVAGLAHRLSAGPVRVLLVKPGFIDTPMTDGLVKTGPLWASAATVAAAMDRAELRGRSVTYAPWFWAPIMLVIRNLPQAIFNRLKI